MPSVTEEIFRLKYEIQGQQAIEKAKADAKALDTLARQMVEAFKAGTLTYATHGQQVEQLATKIAKAKQELAMFHSVAGGNSNKAGQTFYQLGQALEDMQYGLHGAINNLTFLANQSGQVGPKMQAAIAGAAVAAGLLARNLDDVMRFFGMGWQPAEEGAAGLEKKLEGINEELGRMKTVVASGFFTDLFKPILNPLGIYTSEQNLNAQAKQLTTQEDLRRQKGFEAFMSAGGDGSDAALADGFKKFAATTSREKFASAVQKSLEEQGSKAPASEAQEVISQAMAGSRAAFERLMKLAPQYANEMAANDPGRVAARELEVQKAVEDKRLVRDLNQQGQDNEIAGRQQTVADAIGRAGDIRGRIQLGLRRGNNDEQLTGRIAEVLQGQGADPMFAKRRAEEMVKAERQEFQRDGQGAIARIPGAEEAMRRQILINNTLGGMDPQRASDKAAEALARELQKRGVDPDEARFRAFQFAERSMTKLQDDAINGRLGVGPMGKVETYGATDWVRSIQGSMDYAKEQADSLKSIDKRLEQMARNRGGFMV